MPNTAHVMIIAFAFLLATPAFSGDGPDAAAEMELPGTVDAPGYEDFKDADLSPNDVKELEERQEDRNVVSPGLRDEKELDREMGLD